MKFSKRRRAVPLQLMWTIMVAAKLDRSRVPVTTFRQNRLTLKGRSAGQRHTDTHKLTHTDRQTRLKIRALQVCNRANRPLANFSHIAWKNREQQLMHVKQVSAVDDEPARRAASWQTCFKQIRCMDAQCDKRATELS